MPQIIPVIAGAALKAAGFGKILTAIITLAVTAVTSLIFKPKMNAGDLGTSINMSRDAAAPREYIYGRTRTGGTIPYIESTGTKNEILWLVTDYADHEIDSFEAFYIDNESVSVSAGAVTTSPYNGFANVYTKSGQDSQTVETNLDAASTNWTTDHRLRGCAYAVWKLTYDRDVWPTGLPNLSATIKGKKVYDPRLDTTVSGGSGSHRDDDSTTWEWSDNPVLCLLDYLRDSYIGPAFPMSAFDTTNLIAAANVCDEAVTVKAGGTITRYAVNGIINSDLSHKDVVDIFSDAMAGTITFTGGVFRMHPGEYDTPNTDTLDEDSIVELVSWKPAPSRRELVNEVNGLFIDTDNAHQPTNYPTISDSTAVTEDGGDVLPLTLDLPFEQDNRRAQRIAMIAKNRARQRGEGVIRCNLSAAGVQIWDNQKFTFSDMGWTDKVLKITSWTLNPDMTIDLGVKEEDSSVYSWTAASDEQDFDAPGGTASIVDFDSVNPSGLTATAATFVGSDGSKMPAIEVGWSDPGPFVIQTEVQLSSDDGTTWLNYSAVPEESGDGAVITGLVKGTTYKVRIFHVTQGLVRSDTPAVSSSISVTDSTIAGTIINQGDLAVLNQVDTAEIVDEAVSTVVATTVAGPRSLSDRYDGTPQRIGFGTSTVDDDMFTTNNILDIWGEAVVEMDITVDSDMVNEPIEVRIKMLLQSTGFDGSYIGLYAKVGIEKSGTAGISEWLLGDAGGNFLSDSDGTDPTLDNWEFVATLDEDAAGTYASQYTDSYIWTPTSTGDYTFCMAMTIGDCYPSRNGQEDLDAISIQAYSLLLRGK